MQRPVKVIPCINLFLKVSIIIGLIFIALATTNNAKAITSSLKSNRIIADTSVSAAIREQLFNPSAGLCYPLSVKRYYRKTAYKFIWVMPDTITTHAWDAMMLLDCVVQYGLIHADYHPAELLYDKLHAMTAARNKVSSKERAAFDIMLTDAMITLINNLHFGKLNPGCNASQIDGGSIGGFAAEVVLNNALQQPHFIHTIELAQPASKQYTDLQYHMHLLTGLYTGDCYEIPVKDVRKMAINLERLRWNSENEKIYIDINIPAYTLKLHMADSDYLFKVIVGKPSAPTTLLKSTIASFTISHGWNATSKKIYFPFYNRNGISLGNTSDRLSFKKNMRALNDGPVDVEHGLKLVELLLTNDNDRKSLATLHKPIKQNHMRTVTFKRHIPFTISYLTCQVKTGVIIFYPDVYQLDEHLEMNLYNVTNALALDIRHQK